MSKKIEVHGKKGVDKNLTELTWLDKRKQVEVIKDLPFQTIERINAPREKDLLYHEDKEWTNKLIWGDNYYVMCSLLEKYQGEINLIYIDPPFDTGSNFNVKIKVGDLEFTKEPSIIEQKAYDDTWGKGIDSYLQMMYDRLVLMRQLLAVNGSIYVHLNREASHYVKVIMDEIFGKSNFVNEIIWYYSGGGASADSFANKHDVILFYSKDPKNKIFDVDKIRMDYKWVDGQKRADGSERDLEKGKIPDDVMGLDIIKMHKIMPWAEEYKSFDTQKPEALSSIIVQASSRKGDLVADFFCGTGTTLAVAERWGRKWLGCDLGKFALQIARKRLLDIPNCKPFEILNIAKYQTHKFMVSDGGVDAEGEYLKFITQLFRGERIDGYSLIHGIKNGRYLHIGATENPVTQNEIENFIEELESTKNNKGDILGWEFEMGLDNYVQEINKKKKMDLKLYLIPKEVLQVKDPAKEEVKFYEMPYLKIDVKTQKYGAVEIKLKDFMLFNQEDIPEEVRKKIKKFSDYIDYWSIDFDYKDVYHNSWQSFRSKKHPNLDIQTKYTYPKKGVYKIFVKVVDIFGNDVNKLVEVKV